ncbi:hypothetical protein ACUN9Z_13840 [Escherichia sp. HC-CC4]
MVTLLERYNIDTFGLNAVVIGASISSNSSASLVVSGRS